jgi:predicted metal-dependent HD superfamily phosphohydrolase
MDNLIEQSSANITSLFQQSGRPDLLYHNLEHTREVSEAVQLMCSHYELLPEDEEAVRIAAWWHDIGYLYGPAETHEGISAEKARTWLLAHGAGEPLVRKVEGCILATKMPQQPKNMAEEIICDADLFHLGTPEFSTNSKMLRKEIELLTGQELKGGDWRSSTIRLLEHHRYHTEFARNRLEEGKQKNLEDLVRRQEEKQRLKAANAISAAPHEPAEKPAVPAARTQSKQKGGFGIPKRGIETMFRLTSRNHMELSGMADSKANIMISVNAIIISVVLSFMLRRLEDMPHLLVPTLILLVVNITTIIFAVLATRPNLTKGYFTQDDIHKKKANLLFFGNFHKMGLEDFDWGMKEMMKDREYLYSSIIRDIYFLGKVLGRKYYLLRMSYSVFMYGLVIAILAFALAEVWIFTRG